MNWILFLHREIFPRLGLKDLPVVVVVGRWIVCVFLWTVLVVGLCVTLVCRDPLQPRSARFTATLRAAVTAREDAVLARQRHIDVAALSTSTSFHEALLEVVWQEGVQDRVDGRIRVAQTAGQQKHSHHVLRLGRLRWRENQWHLVGNIFFTFQK